MARLRGGLGAGQDQDQNPDQQLPQIGGAMGNLPQQPAGGVSLDPTGNTDKPRDTITGGANTPTQGLKDPSKSPAPQGMDSSEHSNDTPGMPQSPTPIASQPPQPFTPLPQQDASTMVGNQDPAAFTSPVFGGTSALRQPGLLSGGTGGQLRGGLGAPSTGGNPTEDPLAKLMRLLSNRGGQGSF